jgi:hypothetical protein
MSLYYYNNLERQCSECQKWFNEDEICKQCTPDSNYPICLNCCDD